MYIPVHVRKCTFLPLYCLSLLTLPTDHTPIAKTGRISPTGSLRCTNRYGSDYSLDSYAAPPPNMNSPHWYRYQDKSCCHPKNVWHCCCHRDTYWNGRREVNSSRGWYNCRGTGFCRCLLLILMWLLVWPFVLVGLCCFGCFWLCYMCCVGFDDD